ncbi:phage baseplate assembly protein [Marinomonas transparens]|uniref:Phage late control gene D protein (GPD) n=1 Tax=Marinomonas transparens TaxID=2795388 RepID=A0A934MZ48_9GAMM|nr:hypothetical protein [Marinomonas transparens]MBJ7537160.1 hypothetical protein [Marinomonas transparens]
MSGLVDASLADELIVHIGGKVHSYWTQATIARSMERGAHSFDLSLTDSFEIADSAMQNALVRSVQPGMDVAVLINDEQIVAGYVDDVNVSYDGKSHSLNITGRSKIADLIDCSGAGQQFQLGQSLTDIANTLCQPFGIQVSVADSATSAANEPFKSDQMLDLGQPIWEFLEGLARLKAVLLASDADGNLVITRAGAKMADVALVLGENIKTASSTFSDRSVFSEYSVYGQQAKNPSTNQDAKAITQNKGNASAEGVRYRPFAVSADIPSDTAACETRAKWQKNVFESRAKSMTYTVQGWRQRPNGKLWEPNALVSVEDPWLGWDGELLITETRITLDEGGSNTQIHLMPKGAFDLL